MRTGRRPHEIEVSPVLHVVEGTVAARDVLAFFVDVRRGIVCVAAAGLVGMRAGEIP